MPTRFAEIEVPEDDPFKYDKLNRKPIVEFLSSLIENTEGPFVMALDSPWGTGKTTFVKMLQYNLKLKDNKCVYFNAWEVDYAVDPLIALVSSIEDIGPYQDKGMNALKRLKENLLGVARTTIKSTAKIAGIDINDELKELKEVAVGNPTGDLVEEFKEQKINLEKFRKNLQETVKQLSKTEESKNLIFFIDELDRCRPNFAIELLERIKHIFNVDNIIFVLSVDKQQLESIIQTVYGSKIDTQRYLQRFIDLEYRIPKETKVSQGYTHYLLEKIGLSNFFENRKGATVRFDKENFSHWFSILSSIMDLSLREQEQCITRFKIVTGQIPGENHYLFPELTAALIILRLKKPDMFVQLQQGLITPIKVLETLKSSEIGSKLFSPSHYNQHKAIPSEYDIGVFEAYFYLVDPSRDEYRQILENDPESVRKLEAMNNVASQNCIFDDGTLPTLLKKIDLVANVT
jgi:hypothetical protein